MSKLDLLNQDMKTAMKRKDKETLSTVRMLKSALQTEQINKGEELTEEEELTILAREKKQRMESLNEFKSAGRDDLVLKLEKELSIVNNYLPEQLSEDDVRSIVQETIAKTQASSMQDMGKVMGALMPKVKGKADGSLVSSIVKEELNK
ncbi:MAG: GatB/YqeY domain-containing protein [Alkalibacterium gilvum]|uniref:GatB/YqeY domain-containing protein n=1 Tax=Alkalibacterium gilvum TaxID=1130080 RepID=UPI00264EFFB6|nr:GatB/YqeY domain-containing protein [Alkalibacterium sp.]MDN6736348.1 GatB/YqeY domain-containing protein [Tetragenococcus koreensis]